MKTFKFNLENTENHEDVLNELLDLNCSFEMYYFEDGQMVYLEDGDDLLDAYEFYTNVFYLETNTLKFEDLDDIQDYAEII